MIHHLIRDHHVLWFVPAITKAEIFYKEMVSINKIFLSLLFLFLIPGLCACGSGRKTAPATGPDVVPAEVSTEVPAAEPLDNSVPQKEEASSDRSKSASEQAMDVVTELDAIGERMDGSAAYIVLDTAGKTVWKVPLAGIEFQVPDFIRDAHGGIRALDGKEIIPGTGIVGLSVVYFSITENEYYDLLKKMADYADDTEDIDESFGLSRRYMETVRTLNSHRHPLFSVIGIGNDRGVDEILAAEKKEKLESGLYSAEELEVPDNRTFTKIGSAEDYNFFFVQEPYNEEDLTKTASDGDQFKAEYESLFNSKDQIIPNFIFSRPIGIGEMIAEGTGLVFETLDIHDNPVKSADIFSGHKATMLNIWATTCTACISEMPDLMRLNKEFEEKGGQIVGLVFDAVEKDLITEAKEIADELHIDFLTLLHNDYLRETFDAMSYPPTYFINEKGEIMGEPLMGAKIKAYRDRMSEYFGY